MGEKKLLLQCLLGMQFKDFVIMAADQIDTETAMEDILVSKDDEDKMYELSNSVVMGINGEVGDRTQLSEFLSKNMDLYKMKNKYYLSTASLAHFTRKTMVDNLRNANPHILNILIAGFDKHEGGQLYFLDYLASCIKVPFAAHGIAGLLSLSILSKNYKPNLTEAQAYEIIKLCVCEIHKRFIINLPNFCVKTISKDGIKILPVISGSSVRSR